MAKRQDWYSQVHTASLANRADIVPVLRRALFREA